MTNEEKRIAIAEACGWRPGSEDRKRDGTYRWDTRRDGRIFASQPCLNKETGVIESYLCDKLVPDYLSDLNAMHEAEKQLTHEQDSDYSDKLERVVSARASSNNSEDLRRFRSATAAQRAEAFGKTLGLW